MGKRLANRRSAGRLALLLFACAGCGSTRYGQPWGARATLRPVRERVFAAARDAVFDPVTWVPVAGALAIRAGAWDREISDWARRETPLFGSVQGAEDASHDWRAYSRFLWNTSMLAVPSGDEPWPWILNKAKGFAVQTAADRATSELTSLAKSEIGRERPDASDERSMPSGHASASFAYATLARRNFEALPVPPWARVSLQTTALCFASLDAWARVEAGAHYPTDVLVGAALGNFVARFIDDVFLDVRGVPQLTAGFAPDRDAWTMGVAWAW